jgi:thiamine kinase-like enzyme
MRKKLAGNYKINSQKLDYICTNFMIEKSVSHCKKTIIQTYTSEKYVLLLDDVPKYFLKQIPEYASDLNSVSLRAKLIEFLISKQSYLTPSLYYSLQKLPYVIYKKRVWQLYTYISGEVYKKSQKSMNKTASFLSLYHNLADLFCKNLPQKLQPQSFIFKIELLSELLENDLKDVNSSYKISFFQQVNILISTIKDYDFSHFSRTWIHGDFSHNNIIYQDKNPVCLVDFDNSTYGYCIRDLSELIVTFLIMNYKYKSTNFKEPLRFIEVENSQSFKEIILTYSNCRMVNESETVFIPILLRIIFIEFAILGFIRKDFNLTNDNFIYISDFVKETTNKLLSLKIIYSNNRELL